MLPLWKIGTVKDNAVPSTSSHGLSDSASPGCKPLQSDVACRASPASLKGASLASLKRHSSRNAAPASPSYVSLRDTSPVRSSPAYQSRN